jgi:hypothetical protein
MPGEWIKGMSPPQTFALDLLHDLLSEWGHIFRSAFKFEILLLEHVCPSIKALVRTLQEDYLAGSAKSGQSAAAALSTRVIRVVRVLLLEYATLSAKMLSEADLLVTLMLHSMQPYRGDIDSPSSLHPDRYLYILVYIHKCIYMYMYIYIQRCIYMQRCIYI